MKTWCNLFTWKVIFSQPKLFNAQVHTKTCRYIIQTKFNSTQIILIKLELMKSKKNESIRNRIIRWLYAQLFCSFHLDSLLWFIIWELYLLMVRFNLLVRPTDLWSILYAAYTTIAQSPRSAESRRINSTVNYVRLEFTVSAI